IGVGMLLLAALVVILGAISEHRGFDVLHFFKRLYADFYANVGTELASIAITVLIIDRLNQHRAEQRQRTSLVLQMGSPDNGFAVEAVRILTAQGWLNNGLLRGVNLSRANLEGAHLQKVDLTGAHLALANLHKTKLTGANLSGAYLQGANLEGATLCGARLTGANLNDANLRGVHFDAETLLGPDTILPDCTYWSPGTDMERFTDPKHPDFWRSHNPNSPACLLPNEN
ncbi:MAG TPA: pentapeptide repeat-containing protein, partial [Phototrophicaceae bacterium]|nr:pentapeptide repeat-containing protein [Phototrophicaceae bacterium]